MLTISGWAHAQDLAFAILTDNPGDPRRIGELTFLTNRSISLYNPRARLSTYRGGNLDGLVVSAASAGYAHLLILQIGSYLRDADLFMSSVVSKMTEDTLAVGHFLNHDESYFEISTRCLYLNLALWARIGRPGFGSAMAGPLKLHLPSASSEQRGSLSRYHLSPSGLYVDFTMLRPGWNLLHRGLEADAHFAPFSEDAVESLGFIDPAHEDYILHFNDWQQLGLDWLTRTWFVNTEALRPPEGFQGPIKQLLALASGLKPNVILEACGWNRATEIIYYDSSRIALHFKRWLIEHWDGSDYISAIARWSALWPAAPKSVVNEELEDAVAHVYAAFGGPSSFRRHWRRYRQLRHVFLRANLHTSDMRTIVAHIGTNGTKVVIWWSNVFHSAWTHAFRSEAQCYETFDRWIKLLRGRSPELFVVGFDHRGMDVSGPLAGVLVAL